MRGPLLLILAAIRFWAPDLALLAGGDPSGATYQANGLYGAALALVAADAIARPAGRPRAFDAAVLGLSAVLWCLQFACDLFWVKAGPTAAICDDVMNRPITLACAAAMLGATWALDNLTKVGRNG